MPRSCPPAGLAFLFTLVAWRCWAVQLPAHPAAAPKHAPLAGQSYDEQFRRCTEIRVDSSNEASQNAAAQAGAIETIAHAMKLFPLDKRLVTACTYALSGVILFNRANGLRAGRLGCLNHTLEVYKQNMDDPEVMLLGGSIGAYFDYVDENRHIAAELGGIKAIIQNIRNNFNGQYSEWNYRSVKESLFALSSGCWANQDICSGEGFPELAVRLMNDHGHEDKIAEETMQATKALMFRSDAYRHRLVNAGVTDAMVHVMQVNPNDRGALDLACENFAYLVGPHVMGAPTPGKTAMVPFSREIQNRAVASGAVDAILDVVTGGRELQHKEHGAFNFDVDLAYNVNKDCYFALAHLTRENPQAQKKALATSIVDTVVADLKPALKDPVEKVAGCMVLKSLGKHQPPACR